MKTCACAQPSTTQRGCSWRRQRRPFALQRRPKLRIHHVWAYGLAILTQAKTSWVAASLPWKRRPVVVTEKWSFRPGHLQKYRRALTVRQNATVLKYLSWVFLRSPFSFPGWGAQGKVSPGIWNKWMWKLALAFQNYSGLSLKYCTGNPQVIVLQCWNSYIT